MSAAHPAPPTAEPAHDPYAALRVVAYRRFLFGSLVANLGRQATGLAAAWQVYQWTRSATALGLIGLVNFLPYIALALPAGQFADRYNRRRVLQLSLVGTSLVSALLALVATRPQLVADWPLLGAINSVIAAIAEVLERAGTSRELQFDEPALGAVFLLLLLNAALRTLGNPARATIVPLLLPKEKLANGITWSTSGFEVSAMAGPALAGFIIAAGGYTAAYAIDALLGFGFVLLLFGVRYEEPPRVPEGRTWRSLLAGAEFIWQRKIILAACSLDLFAVLLGGAVALLPIYADEILHVGPVGLGWLRAAPAIGAVAMALALAHLPPLRRPGVCLLWSVAGFGGAIVGFGLSTWFWLSFAMLFLSGVFDNVSVVVRQSLVQLLTPDHLRGRVSAVNQIFVISSNEVGAFRAGTMAALLGPITAVVAGGVGTVLVVLGIARLCPQVRTIGRLHELKPL
jgi:MFS family permease